MKEAGTGKQEGGGPDTLHGFRGLIAWQKADDLAVAVYSTLRRASQSDPWLQSQANRATFSVSANIAEGYGRRSLGDYMRFLDIATGSLNELENCLHFMVIENLLKRECHIPRIPSGNDGPPAPWPVRFAQETIPTGMEGWSNGCPR